MESCSRPAPPPPRSGVACAGCRAGRRLVRAREIDDGFQIIAALEQPRKRLALLRCPCELSAESHVAQRRLIIRSCDQLVGGRLDPLRNRVEDLANYAGRLTRGPAKHHRPLLRLPSPLWSGFGKPSRPATPVRGLKPVKVESPRRLGQPAMMFEPVTSRIDLSACGGAWWSHGTQCGTT